jgi:putative addiction module killer protein
MEIIRSDRFDTWFSGLQDRGAKARILMRLRRLELGNPGQHRVLSQGITELKIDCGPGYRIYYMTIGTTVVVLLCGGDKMSQQNDISKAIEIANLWRN